MSTPETMKALKCQGPKQSAVVQVPLPAMRPDYALVKVSCVALNPTDWKHIDYIPTENATVGCDYSGTVVAVGPKVRKAFTPGARIAGFTHGVNAVQPQDGCFAEYCVVKADVQMAVPDTLSDLDAATFGVAITTVGQSLYQWMGLPLPTLDGDGKGEGAEEGKFILIYGGSTTTGLAALQFARLSGFIPVATCSPRNNALVESYGAAAAFDYSDPAACAAAIRAHTRDTLVYALDCISTPESARICADSLAPEGASEGTAKYCSLLRVALPRADVETGYTLGYTALGEHFKFREGVEFAAKPADFEFAVRFWEVADRLLAEGKVRAPPVEECAGGLEGVRDGLDKFRAGLVSGRKLVYRIAAA